MESNLDLEKDSLRTMGSASAKGGQQGDTFETVRFVAATCRTCDVKKSSTPRNPYAYSNDQHLFFKITKKH